MPLPVFEKQADIPKGFEAAYEEKDGKFVPIDESAGLKAKNADLVSRLNAAKPFQALAGTRTADEIQADLDFAQKARDQKAKDEGNFEALKTQLVEKHQGREKKLLTKLDSVLRMQAVESAIVEAGGSAKVLLPHILPFVKVVESDDDFATQVVDAKGNARITDGQATPMTIAQLVEQFKADDTFAGAFAASGASGSGARNDAGRGGAGAVVVIPKNATPQEYRRLRDEAIKAGKSYKVGD
jgi:hypothetical protein